MLGHIFKAILQRSIAAHDQRWQRLCNFVAQPIWVTQNSCGVAHGVTRLNGAKGNDLRHVVAAIFFRCVTDHFFAIPRVEVHVDIGHRHTTGVQEAFKEKVVFDGVEIGDAQCIGNSTTSS